MEGGGVGGRTEPDAQVAALWQADLGIFRQAGAFKAVAQVLAKPHVMLLLAFGGVVGHAYFDGGQGLGVDVLALVLRDDKGGIRTEVG